MELIQPSVDESSRRPESLSERLDEARTVASLVFDLLTERRLVLSSLYPYEVDEHMISRRCEVDIESSRYLAMLSLTVAHAFKVHLSSRPHEMFEQIVARVLRNRGLLSVGFAAIRRKHGAFDRALYAACEQVCLRAAPNAAARATYAHDRGVDILCHLSWEAEVRENSWVFIGQATVARSDEWGEKMNQPSLGAWKRFVGVFNHPMRFLAVPHHVDRPMMEMLATDGDGVVLDRLRLVKFKDANDCSEREMIRAIAHARVEPLGG